jgi:hypothetical protein
MERTVRKRRILHQDDEKYPQQDLKLVTFGFGGGLGAFLSL